MLSFFSVFSWSTFPELLLFVSHSPEAPPKPHPRTMVTPARRAVIEARFEFVASGNLVCHQKFTRLKPVRRKRCRFDATGRSSDTSCYNCVTSACGLIATGIPTGTTTATVTPTATPVNSFLDYVKRNNAKAIRWQNVGRIGRSRA
jgi:hypothetical protein